MRTKTEEKRQTILEVAKATFGELGFERASMSEICARVGGSKATLYNYFPTKEALFLEVIFRASEADFENTLLSLQADGLSLQDSLSQFGRSFLSLLYSADVMAMRRLLVSEAGRNQIGPHFWDLGPRRGSQAIASFLHKAMQQGLLRTAPADIATNHLQALLESELIQRFFFQHLPPPDAQEIAQCTDRAVQTFMAAYGPSSRARPEK